jgi:hypothetical protein
LSKEEHAALGFVVLADRFCRPRETEKATQEASIRRLGPSDEA